MGLLLHLDILLVRAAAKECQIFRNNMCSLLHHHYQAASGTPLLNLDLLVLKEQGTLVWVQVNCETKFLVKWLTHFGFGGQQSGPGSGARIPQ
jgi:hypothetical protein